MAISTRNQLNATVTAIQAGASNDVIELALAGGEKLAAVDYSRKHTSFRFASGLACGGFI